MGEQAYPDEEHLDINGAADYMSVSTKTVRRYIKSGRIKAKKVRNVWYCGREELDRLMGKGEASEAAGAGMGEEVAAEIRETLELLKRQSADIDNKLYLISRERENRITKPELAEKEREIEYLRADNQKLAEEIQRLKSEASEARANGPKDAQLLKGKQEEIETLKAMIASNERGLTLLRAEVAGRDEAIRQKDILINELRETVRTYEEESAGRGGR